MLPGLQEEADPPDPAVTLTPPKLPDTGRKVELAARHGVKNPGPPPAAVNVTAKSV